MEQSSTGYRVYSLTYRKTDQAGNRSERVTRTVTVVNDDPDKARSLSANKVEENLPAGRAVDAFRGAIRMIRRAGRIHHSNYQ